MALDQFKTKLSFDEVLNILNLKFEGQLVHEKKFELSHDNMMLLLIYERMSFRNGSSMGLVVTIEQQDEVLSFEVISTGSGEGLLNIDWGSGKSFVKSVRKIIETYCKDTNRSDYIF
jgi:hypothetical protein